MCERLFNPIIQIKIMALNENSMGADPSQNEQWLLSNRIMKMNDAEAEKDYHKMWTYFMFCFKRVMVYLDSDIHDIVEQDLIKLSQLETEIKNQNLNDATKANYLEELHKNFKAAHESYIFMSLPRMGNIVVSHEAELNYTKYQFDLLAKMISDQRDSIETTIKKNETEEKNEK